MAFVQLCLLVLFQGAASHGWVTTPTARNVLVCDSRHESVWGCKSDRETKPPHPGDQPGPVGGNICAGDNNNGISNEAKQQMMVPGPIQGRYTAGEVVEMHWHVYADHGGWYSYRICLDGSDTEECFRQNILSNTAGEQKMRVTHGSTSDYYAQMRIPENVACDRCTLSWFWHGDPSYEDNIFVNCIDISISGPRPSPKPTPAPTGPTPTPAPSPTPPAGACPGGSMEACLRLCPGDVKGYKACVAECDARCKKQMVI